MRLLGPKNGLTPLELWAVTGVTHSSNYFTGGAAHGFNHLTGSDDYRVWALFEMSGITEDEFILLYNLAHQLGRTETATWFGHNYTGNGNQPVGRFRFQNTLHTGSALGIMNLFSHRFALDLLRIAHVEGGITNIPTLTMLAAQDGKAFLTEYVHGNERRTWELLYWSLFTLVSAIALVTLAILWRRYPHSDIGLLPTPVFRVVSVLSLIVFTSSACIFRPDQKKPMFLLPPNGSLGGGSEGGAGGGTGNGNLSVLGSYYFISTHNGSTDIVTDSVGKAVAYFAYDPYGKVNRELTNLDPDGNGVQYGENFQFTGQELESGTGLYNYHARIHDPETGRFLQPDPVHTDQPGQDNWDRYAYVWGNPVNFGDPTGMSTNYVHMFNQMQKHYWGGYKYATKRAKDFVDRLSQGKKHNDPNDALNVTGRKIGEAGTFFRHMFSSTANFLAVISGAFDFVCSLVYNAITGRPAPYITYHGGGFAVHNSVFADSIEGSSYTSGMVAHIQVGDSKATLKHEVAHIHQGAGDAADWGHHDGFVGSDYSADLSAGLFGYNATPFIYYALGGPDAVKGGAAASMLLYGTKDPGQFLRAYRFYSGEYSASLDGTSYNGWPNRFVVPVLMSVDWHNYD